MSTQQSASRDLDKYILRMPPGMRQRIAKAAEEANRSMNAEIVQRLEQSFDLADRLAGLEARARAAEARAEALHQTLVAGYPALHVFTTLMAEQREIKAALARLREEHAAVPEDGRDWTAPQWMGENLTPQAAREEYGRAIDLLEGRQRQLDTCFGPVLRAANSGTEIPEDVSIALGYRR